MTAPHQIQTLKFDLDIPSLSKNKAIQGQTIDVFHAEFNAMLNEVFDTYGKDEDLIIESATLLLNPVAIGNFKKDIVAQSREQLIAYFEKHKSEPISGNGISLPQAKDGTGMHPLLHYLFHGIDSWASEGFSAFEESWKNQLQKKGFTALLKTVRWETNAVKRLVYQLGVPVLYETVRKIIPAEAPAIKAHHEFLAAYCKKWFSKSASSCTSEQTLWIATFDFLLIKRTKSFSRTEYWNHQLTQLAAANNIDFNALTNNLLMVLREAKETNPLLVAYFHHLETIQKTGKTEYAAKIGDQSDISMEAVEKLLWKPDKSNEDIASVKKWILASDHREMINRFWIAPLREKVLEMVVGILAPTGTKFILHYHQEMLNQHAVKPIAASKESLKRSIWLFTLDYLTAFFSSTFEAKEFVVAHARKIANRNGIDFAVFIQNLLTSVRAVPLNDVKHHQLLMILKALADEQLVSGIDKSMMPDSFDPMGIDEAHEISSDHTKNGVGASKRTFKKMIGSFLSAYRAATFPSTFEAGKFVFSEVQKTAKRNKLDYNALIQELLASVRPLSHDDLKFYGLAVILESLSDGHFQSRIVEDIPLQPANVMSINKVRDILSHNRPGTVWEKTLLRQWLLDKNNRGTIKKNWIDDYDAFALMQIIDILNPRKKSFIVQSMLAIGNVFRHCHVFDSHAPSFRKFLYIHLIGYLQDNPGHFNKTEFTDLQIRAVLRQFDINYKTFLGQYRTFLLSAAISEIKKAEYFGILNVLQNTLEKKYRSNRPTAIDEAEIEIVFEYLETAKIKRGHGALKSTDYKRIQDVTENLLVNHPQQWFLFLVKQDRPLHIHKSVLGTISTSLLRNIVVFQTNYNKLLSLRNHLGRYGSISLKSQDLALVFYLEEGFFPNWVPEASKHMILNKTYSRQTCSVLLQHRWSSNAVQHWVQLTTRIHKKEALKNWTNHQANHSLFLLYDRLEKIYQSMESYNKHYSFMAFEESFWSVFFGAVRSGNAISSMSFMRLFFREWERLFRISFFNNGEVAESLKSGLYLPVSIFIAQKTKPATLNTKDAKADQSRNEPNHNNNGNSAEKVTIETFTKLTKWYMENTGLIIAHPFLLQLFKYLEFLDDRQQFKNEQATWRAVYLLHYMATGETGNINETDLAMPKILTGMPIQNPIPTDIVLSESETSYANEVLEVIISRWDKLGKTSKDGLRNTFLKRKGILEEKNEAFQLTVETSGTDILLDYIPWNISIVKLPWVNNIIYTSWR